MSTTRTEHERLAERGCLRHLRAQVYAEADRSPIDIRGHSGVRARRTHAGGRILDPPGISWCTCPLCYGNNKTLHDEMSWRCRGHRLPALRSPSSSQTPCLQEVRPSPWLFRPDVHDPQAALPRNTQQLLLPLEIPAPSQLITLPEAQRWLGMSADVFTRLLLSGHLPVVHLGRKVRIEDMAWLAWLTEHGRLR